MRRMLIDDDDAVRRLGDDIGVVQLRARHTQRSTVRVRRVIVLGMLVLMSVRVRLRRG